MKLERGDKAPDFELASTGGDTFRLSRDMKGKSCVIYFYPKDFTPGCTMEACSFRDEFAEFRGLDIEVIGISKDTIESHNRFKKRYNLPFELLSDLDGEVCRKYDALVPFVNIPKRITYLLDEDHRVSAVFTNMFNAKKHVQQMLKQTAEAKAQ
jgi:peroxiredoxin Q/BCP